MAYTSGRLVDALDSRSDDDTESYRHIGSPGTEDVTGSLPGSPDDLDGGANYDIVRIYLQQ